MQDCMNRQILETLSNVTTAFFPLSLRFCAIVVLLCSVMSAGAAAADSPKQALLAQDAAARSGNVDADLEFYQTKGEKQEKLAHVIAEGDVALAKLQDAVAKRFGAELATAVIHAAGTEDARDIEAAEEKIESDQATIEFNDHSTPLRMVKVDGKWKISLSDMVGEATDLQLDQLTKNIAEFTSELGRLTSLVENQKFRSGEGVRDRVAALHERLFKTEAPPVNGHGI
jgi:hypothetical protein